MLSHKYGRKVRRPIFYHSSMSSISWYLHDSFVAKSARQYSIPYHIINPQSPVCRYSRTIFDTRFLWLVMTPFGNPVVPLEYTTKATSFSGLIFAFLHRTLVLGSKISFHDCNLSGQPSAGFSPKKIILSLGIPALAAAFKAVGYKAGRVQIALALLSLSWWANSSTV